MAIKTTIIGFSFQQESMRVIAFLALLATTAVAAADEFVNEQVSRFVDLTSASVVRESVDVLVKARSAAASTYQLAFALPAPAHVAVSSRSPASGRQGNAVDCIVQKGVVKGWVG